MMSFLFGKKVIFWKETVFVQMQVVECELGVRYPCSHPTSYPRHPPRLLPFFSRDQSIFGLLLLL